MIENMMKEDEWVLDTPYLRRWRRQVEEAHDEGLEQGREEKRESRRQDILKLVLWRYKPYAEEYIQLQNFLASIMADSKFTKVIDAITSIDDFKQFYQVVEEAAQPHNEMEAVAV